MNKIKKYLHIVEIFVMIIVFCINTSTFVAAGPYDEYIFKDPIIETYIRNSLGIYAPNPVQEIDLENIYYVSIYNETVSNLEDLKMMPNLTGISLYNANIQNSCLTADMFINNPNIESIEIVYNDITTLPTGVFNGLSNLYSINLAYNNITTLPINVFDSLPTLNYLDLEGNKITTINSSMFGNNTDNLLILNLLGNEITIIEDGAFSNHRNMEDLNLAYNNITTLSKDSFSGLDTLGSLVLRGNKIETLEADYFHDLDTLYFLDLSMNKISTIQSGDFSELINLEYLYLEYNWIESLNPESFKDLSSLYFIYLNNNRLAEISEDVFKDLSNLNELYISDNQIETIHPNAFTGLSNLYYLNLDYNELSILNPDIFDSLINIESISLRYNRLANLPVGLFKNNSKLMALDLSINRLVTLPLGIFDSTPKLRYIDLYQNSIIELPDNLFNVSFEDWKPNQYYDNYTLTMEQVFIDEKSPRWFDSGMSLVEMNGYYNLSVLVSKKWHIGPVPMETSFIVDSGKLSPIHFAGYNDADQTTSEEKKAMNSLAMLYYKYSFDSLNLPAIKQEVLALLYKLIPAANGKTLEEIIAGLKNGTIYAPLGNELAVSFVKTAAEMVIDYESGRIDSLTINSLFDYLFKAYIAGLTPGIFIDYVPPNEVYNIKQYIFYELPYTPYGASDMDDVILMTIEEDIFRTSFDMMMTFKDLKDYLINNTVEVNGKPITANSINEWTVKAINAMNGKNYNLQTSLLYLISDSFLSKGAFEQYPYMYFWHTGNFCQDQTITFTTFSEVSVISAQGIVIGEYIGTPLQVSNVGTNQKAVTISGGEAYDVIEIELRYTGNLNKYYDSITIASFDEAELRDLTYYIYTDMKTASETELISMRMSGVDGIVNQANKTVVFQYPDGTDIKNLNIESVNLSAGCTYDLSNNGVDFSNDVTLRVHNCSLSKFTAYTIQVQVNNNTTSPSTQGGTTLPSTADRRMMLLWIIVFIVSLLFVYFHIYKRRILSYQE